MVTLESRDGELLLVARPNHSASWRTNRRVIVVMGSWCLLAALFCIDLGLWPIAPFLGLEVIAVAAGLYTACRKLEQRHVLHFRPDTLVVEKGTYYPRLSWRLQRTAAFISVETQTHPWEPLKIFLCNRNEQIAIGHFLNPDETRQLLRQLRAQGLAVRNFSKLSRAQM